MGFFFKKANKANRCLLCGSEVAAGKCTACGREAKPLVPLSALNWQKVPLSVGEALGALARIVRRVLCQQQQACLPGARRRSGVILAERDAPGLAHEAEIVGCFIRVGAPPVPL